MRTQHQRNGRKGGRRTSLDRTFESIEATRFDRARAAAEDNLRISREDCDHLVTEIKLEPPGSVHYARRVCRACGSFMCLVAHPANEAKRRRNAKLLALMRDLTTLDSWAREFVDSIAAVGKTRLSQSQQRAFDEIAKEYLFGDNLVIPGEENMAVQPEAKTAVNIERPLSNELDKSVRR
jgi:hypothetical protein